MDEGGGLVEFDVPEFSSSVLSQLNELRLQGKLCDIIVHIQGQPFRAHKAVLAASSPYFRDHSALGTMSGLSISVIKSPEVFEQLLAFCYTGRMSLHLRDVVSFLTAASFLQMQAVIDRCTKLLEGIHTQISLPPSGSPGKDGSLASRNGVKERSAFLDPTQISPPHFLRGTLGSGGGAEPGGRGPGKRRLQEEGHSDRGSSDGVSEAELEQVELIGRDGQVTDVRVKLEKSERPVCSDSSSAGDDGYHTELVDGEQVLAVSVGSYGPVLPPSAYSYPPPAPSSLTSLGNPSPTRSMLGGFHGGRGRPRRPVATAGRGLSAVQPDHEDGDAAAGGAGLANDMRERSIRGQWSPYGDRLVCVYCGKSFNQKGSLDRHMRLHMGITPFACKFCGKKYTRKDQLEYHIRGHTDNKPFHCHVCGKCFPFQGTLNQHLRKKHLASTDSPEIAAGGAEPNDVDSAPPPDGHAALRSHPAEDPPGSDNGEGSASGSP
ncbi:zinc finger and BTB domain-containing protein 34-like [Megalops cyprinoides]|uniref:zinc finger and BTB domain-containing protein 34-like n=1 Tax=Megalops cyprinoides TaxID=118141 RepID=UPI0018647D22|nr:zinc finger and BTB domain-containing protein 34-like [Megalops cyprinoides]